MLSPLGASVTSLVRSYSSVAKQIAVCIVGSGPAGFYTAHQVRISRAAAAAAGTRRTLAYSVYLRLPLQLLKLYGDDVTIDILVSATS
jgi:cation diffusion facilitator CzcD-associated flavoprotein CzcO